jgi:hypothetical protein
VANSKCRRSGETVMTVAKNGWRLGRSFRVYAVLAVIFAASSWLTWFLNDTGLLKELLATPAVLALLGVLYQSIRDEARYSKELDLQHDRQRFDLGVTSHMADVAFDRHVAFCEEYAAEVHATIQALFGDLVPTGSAFDYAKRLIEIQRKHCVWITPEMESQLVSFNEALREIGLYRQQLSQGMYSSAGFALMNNLTLKILGLHDGPLQKMDKEIAAASILELMRTILGVRQLIVLRERLMELGTFSKSGARN